MKEFLKEAILWRQLKHPNVLPFLGLYFLDVTRERICLISPWMEKGNLTQYIKDDLELTDRIVLAYDVASGLTYLHKKRVIHGDLKGVNILVTACGRATIGDFGLSRLTESSPLPFSSTTTNTLGTARWLAPECLISHQRASYPSDVYAFGCVCYEIFTNRLPFYQFAHDAAIVVEFTKGNCPIRLPQIGDGIWSIMQDCWHQDPFERPVANELPARFAAIVDGAIDTAEDWHDALTSCLWHNIQYPEMCPPGSELADFLSSGFLRSLLSWNSSTNTLPSESFEEAASSHIPLTKAPCILKACLFYAIVVQDFQAQSSDNLEAKYGDAIVIVAVLHQEWFIAKTIGHPGCTGMIPVKCVTVYDLVTGCVLYDIDDLIASRNLMNVQGGKWNTIKFKENSIDLTIIDPESPDKLVQVNVSFPPQAHSSPIITFGHTISIHDEKHQKQIYPWIYHPLVLSHGLLFQVKTSPSPFPRYGHCLSVSNTQSGELYMFGGKTSYHAKPNNDFYIIDIKKSSVTLVKTKRKPSKRAGHISIMLRDTFIIWGGARNFSGKFALDQGLYMLDIGTQAWTTVHVKGSVPIGRFRHSACLACDTLFIVFGGQLSESTFLNDLWFADLTNIKVEVTWHLIHPASRERPGQRAGHVCVFHKNQLIIFGGTDGSYKYNDTWCFDFQTKKWSEWVCEGKVPEARDGHAAAIIDGIMYIFGGFNTDEKELEDLYALSLSSQIWYSFRYHDIGLSPGKRIGHAMVAIGPEIYSVGGRSESLPFSMAQKNSNYIHVLDTRRLDFD